MPRRRPRWTNGSAPGWAAARSSPLRVARVVEASKRSSRPSRTPTIPDYDEAGRLRVDKRVDEINATASDGKGASQVLRMSRSRRRSYGRNPGPVSADRPRVRLAQTGSKPIWPLLDRGVRPAGLMPRAAELASPSRRACTGLEALPRLDGRNGPALVAHDPRTHEHRTAARADVRTADAAGGNARAPARTCGVEPGASARHPEARLPCIEMLRGAFAGRPQVPRAAVQNAAPVALPPKSSSNSSCTATAPPSSSSATPCCAR